MKRISIILAIIAVAIVGVVSYATLAKQAPAEAPTQATAPITRPPTQQELLDAVNTERAKVGVAPLTLDTRLNQSAQYKADDMVERNYRSHYDPDNTKAMNGVQKGYDLTRKPDGKSECSEVSENLSWSTGVSRTLKDVMSGWMGSKPHHDAILNGSYTTTGFGVSFGDQMIVVEHFCKP